MLDVFAAARLEVAREFEAARLSLLEPDGHIREAARRPKNENSLQALPHEIIEAQTELPCQQPGKQALGALSSCLRAVGKVRALNCLKSGSSSSHKPRRVVPLGLAGAGDSSLCSSRSSIVSCQSPTPIPGLAQGLTQGLTQSLPPILRQDTTHRVIHAPSVPSSPQPISPRLPEEKRKKHGVEVGTARRIDDSPSPSPKLPAVFKRTDFVLVQQPVLTAAVTGASAERIANRKGFKPMNSPAPRSFSSESDIGLSMASGISLASGVSLASTLNDDDPEARAARSMSKLQRAVQRTQQVRALATAAVRSSQKGPPSGSVSPSPRIHPKGIKDILSQPAMPGPRKDSKGSKDRTSRSPSSSPPNYENGIKALATMLASKCGDLESAFAHFANNRGTISRLRWETCLSNMHLDTQAFFGMPAGRVFSLAAKDQTSIDKNAWFQFFEPNRAPLFLDLPGQLNSEHAKDGIRTPELLRRRRSRRLDVRVEDIEASDEDNSRPSSACSSSDSSCCEDADIEQKANAVKHIREALSRKSHEELDEEESKLLDEIKEMGLKGVEAFAHILKSKLGTLKRAFWFFDTNQRSKICKVQWETCLLVLHIDLQKLCGLRKDQVFAVMDEKTRGVISKKDWNNFFETTSDVVFEKKLKRKQAKKRSKKAKRRADGQTQEELSVEDLDVDEEEAEQVDSADDQSQNVSGYSTNESSSDQEAPRKKVRRKKQRKHVEPAQQVKEARDDTTKEEPKSRAPRKKSYSAEAQPPSPRMRQRSDQVDSQEPRVIPRVITKRLSTDFDNQASQDQEDEDFRAKVYKELSSLPEGTCKEYMVDSFTARQRDIVKKVAKQLRLWTHVEDTAEATYEFRMGSDDDSTELRVTGGSIVVGNVSAFAQDALRKVRSIPKCGVYQFPASCTETQRSVVRILARGQGLWSCCEGTGNDRHVVVFNHREHVEEMRKQMGSLKPKESLKLPGGLSAVERRIALNIAAEMGYFSITASGDKSCVEVFNMGSFPQDIEDRLRGLPPGAAREFKGPLHENELRVISFMANQLGFACETFPDGTGVGMRVANMQDFTQKVQNELEALQPGDSKKYESPDRMESDKIQKVATNLALQVTRSREGMTVKRPALAREVLRSDEEPAESESGGVELERVAEVFDHYATGYSNGEKVFLRFPDLRKFAEDMQDIHPKRKHEALMRLLGPLEGVFDDTLQLQIDIRHGTRRGLSLRYFHVFLQKASKVGGWSIMRLLFGLLEEESRCCDN